MTFIVIKKYMPSPHFLSLLLWALLVLGRLSRLEAQQEVAVKTLVFGDPNTGYYYKITSYNVTQMAADSTHRSKIRVSRVSALEAKRRARPENIQTLGFNPSLVDFDILCVPAHCYLVCVTSRSRRNVELYKWSRTQFDLQARRDSFARPHAVKLFSIESSQFYIAVAQDQLHLSPYRYTNSGASSGDGGGGGPYDSDHDDHEHRRFIGCVVLKFTRGHERDLRYLQFIRLPFHPLHVHHYRSISSNNASDARAVVQPFENHYLVFSLDVDWAEPGRAGQAYSFIWQLQNDHFWPYRMPRGAEIEHTQRPGRPGLRLPATPGDAGAGLTNGPAAASLTQGPDFWAPVEACFYQLERLLAGREQQSQRLIESAASVWRAPVDGGDRRQGPRAPPGPLAGALANVTAQVVVHGNVTVIGSLIESPQISLLGAHLAPIAALDALSASKKLAQLIRTHSPHIVENKFKQALFKLNYVREKLSRAILANLGPQSLSVFNNQIRFLGPVQAREVQLAGVLNSNVRLNGIPFWQLENELVSLSGAQDIGARVVFEGRVVADVLEIHGLINGRHLLRDAVDITSRRVQVLEAAGDNYVMGAPGMIALELASLATPEVILAHNASVNSIRLADFITRDNRTQLVYGRKSFKRLSMARLDMAHAGVPLNGFNLTQVARQAVRLRPPAEQALAGTGAATGAPPRLFQTLSGPQVSFTRPLRVNKLTLNGIINQHINLSSLIHDSVKTNDPSLQQIFGQKNFLARLRIGRLTTEGALNGIPVSQIFNLNPAPPTPDRHRYQNLTGPYDVPIEGEFKFGGRSRVLGSVSASLVNGVDLARRAVQRAASNATGLGQTRPQLIRGHKTFYRPLRVVNRARLVDAQELNGLLGANETRSRALPYPLVNNIDLRLISAGLDRQMRQPSLVNVDTLEIDGNLNIPSAGANRTTLGSYSGCPLDAIRARALLTGSEDQLIEAPVRVGSLRARAIALDSGTLNDFHFPQDFVLRTAPANSRPAPLEQVHGVKTIEHLVLSPPAPRGQNFAPAAAVGVLFGRGASINQVPHAELQTFIQQERQHSSTGERVLGTLNVHGNLYVKRINGKYWPDDILRRSLSSRLTPPSGATPVMHKRIYSHLVFANTSSLQVRGQLVLRGPIQLEGRMNGANLTEFSKQSATYHDKDLYSTGRRIRNKHFMGGLTVRGGILSKGLINGINFDEMRQRVVSVTPSEHQPRTFITGTKVFKSDVTFAGPLSMLYLNDLPIDHYLRRIKFEPDGRTLRVFGKKTITGALRINRNLFVRGLINGVDFAELRARAISLSPPGGELTFNQTLTVEGDVFMDNLWIDEKNGTIDGVKLVNLLPIGTLGKNELTLTDFRVDRQRDPYGRRIRVDGSLVDCRVACDLLQGPGLAEPRPYGNQTRHQQQRQQQPQLPQPQAQQLVPLAPVYTPQPARPLVWPAQPVFAGTSRPALYNMQRNFTLTRTTPPYSMSSSYQPPMVLNPGRQLAPAAAARQPALNLAIGREQNMRRLSERKPVSVRYEQRAPAPRERNQLVPDNSALIAEQLELLRRQIVSTSVIRMGPPGNLVVGFIQAPTDEVAGLEFPEPEETHVDHAPRARPNFLLLDQIDVPFGRAIHSHLDVGVTTNRAGVNVTSVFSQPGGRNRTELSVLPVAQPNQAKFIQVPGGSYLLLVSQDYSIEPDMCAPSEFVRSNHRQQLYTRQQEQQYYKESLAESGVHVYLFNWMRNSSLPTSGYFDLFQTIDLPQVDTFEKFTYKGSSYVLAISRSQGKIHLLLMRGYAAFQLVSDLDVPSLERVNVMLTHDKRPVLVVYQTSGQSRVMEPVII